MILGITGGFGCGKSSVLRFFESRSYFTLDADEVCRSFYDLKHPLLMAAIRENFGKNCFTPDGGADKKALAKILFDAPEKMSVITQVIYPLLTERINSAIELCRAKNIHGAFELPLLYEAGFEKCFDAVLAVWCPAELRKKRLAGRGFTPEEVDKRDKMQIPPEEKLERANFAVINSGSPDDLLCQLQKAVQLWEQ